MVEREQDEAMRNTQAAVKPKSPPAPGASISPQLPGNTPDRSNVPGYANTAVPRPETKRRPLTQYGTAEEIMKVYKRVSEAEMTPRNFEQAPPSNEEQRKAYPWLLPPMRPTQPQLAGAEQPEALPEEIGKAGSE